MKSLRKWIALLCCALCICGLCAPAALAAEEAPLDDDAAAVVEAEVAGALTGAEDGSGITVKTAAVYDANGDGKVTGAEIAGVFSGYIFAKADDLAGYADQIAADSTFTVTVTKDGVSTVYIAVPVEDYPQLFNAGVFDETVKKLAETQETYKTDGMTLMSYEHIAGELALHAAVYAVTYLLGADQDGSTFHAYYDDARVADLNLDESRAPGWFLEFFGRIVTFLNRILAFFNSIRPF